MKNKKVFFGVFVAASLLLLGSIIAADHIDAPAVKDTAADITDLYVFNAADNNKLVFVANVQGLLSPAATADAKFGQQTMIEFNIDNNGDNVEDLVIQGLISGNTMRIYGPAAPSQPGAVSKVEGTQTAEVEFTKYNAAQPNIGTSNGINVFAGPRDDPFFFDLGQYSAILAGNATSFNNPGTDTFKGTNVLSLVVEVPKSMLNASTGKINVWVETKNKM